MILVKVWSIYFLYIFIGCDFSGFTERSWLGEKKKCQCNNLHLRSHYMVYIFLVIVGKIVTLKGTYGLQWRPTPMLSLSWPVRCEFLKNLQHICSAPNVYSFVYILIKTRIAPLIQDVMLMISLVWVQFYYKCAPTITDMDLSNTMNWYQHPQEYCWRIIPSYYLNHTSINCFTREYIHQFYCS